MDTKRAREICEAATAGEWFADHRGWITVTPDESRPGEEDEVLTLGAHNHVPDIVFAAEARALLPQALNEIETLQAHLAGAEAANAAIELVEHTELNGHVDNAEECIDYLQCEADAGGDMSGRMHDFVGSLRIIVDQLDRQRRQRNWFEVAHKASGQKLIEYALSKVCCKGESHTCDQEAIAAAEGRTDRAIIERDQARADADRMRAVFDAAKRKRESEYAYRIATQDCYGCSEQVAGPCEAHSALFETMLTLDEEHDKTIDSAISAPPTLQERIEKEVGR